MDKWEQDRYHYEREQQDGNQYQRQQQDQHQHQSQQQEWNQYAMDQSLYQHQMVQSQYQYERAMPVRSRPTFNAQPQEISSTYPVDPPAYYSTEVPAPTTPSMERMPSIQPAFKDIPLDKLIAIPSSTAKRASLFLRAYPPSLAAFSITEAEFLQFVDTLNQVCKTSPPLQVLSIAGQIVGLVPIATAQIVGTAVNIAADVGAGAVTYGRSEMELKKANKELFGPRGLKVEIAKLDALAKLAKIPILDASGKFNKNVQLLGSLDEMDLGISTTQRRLDSMQQWIAPLELREQRVSDIPPQNKLGQFSAKLDEKIKVRKNEKTVAKRQEVLQDYGEEYTDIHSKLDKDTRKVERELAKEMEKIQREMDRADRKHSPTKQQEKMEKVQRKMAKAEAERDKEMAKVQKDYEKDMGKLEKDKVKGDKEQKSMRTILWLIVRKVNEGESENTLVDYMARTLA